MSRNRPVNYYTEYDSMRKLTINFPFIIIKKIERGILTIKNERGALKYGSLNDFLIQAAIDKLKQENAFYKRKS